MDQYTVLAGGVHGFKGDCDRALADCDRALESNNALVHIASSLQGIASGCGKRDRMAGGWSRRPNGGIRYGMQEQICLEDSGFRAKGTPVGSGCFCEKNQSIP